MKVWEPRECCRLRMLAGWAPPSMLWWCSGGWLPNLGFQLPNRGVEAVRAALVGDRRQLQGVAVKPAANVLVTLTGFLAVWLAKIAVAGFGVSH